MEKSFWLAETSMKIVLKKLFLTLNNVDVKFDVRELTPRKYTIAKAILIARQVEQIDKHKFVEIAFNEALETTLEVVVSIMTDYSTRKLLLAALK